MKIAIIVGTRPDTLKIYSLYKKMEKDNRFDVILLDVQQGKDFAHQVYDHLRFSPDYSLDCMRQNQNLDSFLELAIPIIKKKLDEIKPDFVLAQGDTMTALATALVAKYSKIRLIHLEAGLRSFHMNSPYPEEMIRFTIDHLADILFTPTEFTRDNLKREGIVKNVFNVGNTIVDLLKMERIENNYSSEKKRILVTVHRRENFGRPLRSICTAIKRLAIKYEDEIEFIIPVHLNPRIMDIVHYELGNIKNIILKPPLDYWSFLSLMKSSYIALSDSGGLQEEICSFGIPLLVLREYTDRQESVRAGFSKLVGSDAGAIMENVSRLLDDKGEYEKMKANRNPFGDGHTAERVIEILEDYDKKIRRH